MNNVKEEVVLSGVPASPGIAIGTALVLGGRITQVERKAITPTQIPAELANFDKALAKTKAQLLEIQKRVQEELDDSDARIFDAHLLIIDDQTLVNEAKETVRKELVNIDFAFNQIIQRYVKAMSKISDPYIKERGADITDVASRVLSNIHGLELEPLSKLPGQRIIISADLKPSDTAALDRDNAQAFATETGSRTSHAAIMARSMKIPAAVGVKPSIAGIRNGDIVIVDGYTGTVVVNPSAETLNLYAQKEARGGQMQSDLLSESRLRPETIDGFRIQLAANIELPEDVEDAKRYRAAGIGLYRTEYMYINRNDLPDEEEQFLVYRDIVSRMEGKPVIIRTMDLGGDKLTDIVNYQHEDNPFLGYRAIRLCLGFPKIFRKQLRAIFRASHYGNTKIMFPMITCAEEIDQIHEILDDIKKELRAEKLPFDENIETGIMIETPSAAIIADRLASKVDFFSIGTNDLVQYTLAVDRNSEKMDYLYQPTHPAILALIKQVATAARAHGIWVGVCGEMAGDPKYTALLLGIGVHELSMSPVSMGPIRRLIRKIKMHEAEDLADKALRCSTAKEAQALSDAFLQQVAPEVFSLTTRGFVDV